MGVRFVFDCRITGVTVDYETGKKVFENEVGNHRHGKHDILVSDGIIKTQKSKFEIL